MTNISDLDWNEDSRRVKDECNFKSVGGIVHANTQVSDCLRRMSDIRDMNSVP